MLDAILCKNKYAKQKRGPPQDEPYCSQSHLTDYSRYKPDAAALLRNNGMILEELARRVQCVAQQAEFVELRVARLGRKLDYIRACVH